MVYTVPQAVRILSPSVNTFTELSGTSHHEANNTQKKKYEALDLVCRGVGWTRARGVNHGLNTSTHVTDGTTSERLRT